MNEAKLLQRLFDAIVSETESNPAFAQRLRAALGERLADSGAQERPRLVGGRRPPGVLDPFAVYEAGAERLSAKLAELNVEQLKDLIAEHSMDPSRLAAKWKTPERLVDLIMSTVSSRARKGEAFRPVDAPASMDGVKSIGEWSETRQMSFAHAVASAEAVLKQAVALDVKGLPGRFAEYLPVLLQANSLKSSPLPWRPDSREHALFYEGASQVWHLLAAGEVCKNLAPAVARHKLSKALAGNALPDPGSDKDRQARDFLVEFATAHALKQRGLAVDMTVEREDVSATADGLPRLVIECKRPAHLRSLRNGVRDGCLALSDRCDGTSTLGMLVLCIDRMLSEIPAAFTDLRGVPSFRSQADLHEWVERELKTGIANVLRTAHRERCQLYPKTPFVGLLLTVPVFVNEDPDGGFLHMLEYMGFFNTGPIRQDIDRPAWRKLLGS